MTTTAPIIQERFDYAFETPKQVLLYLRHMFAYDFALRQIPSGSRVLEIGHGEGHGAKWLSDHGLRLTALEVDPDTARLAADKYASDTCSFELYDGRRLPYDDHSFDAVISFQVIEHIDDDLAFVAQARRVLKHPGLFLVTTPNRLLRLSPGEKPWNIHHVREYDAPHLQTVLQSAFADVTLHGLRGTGKIQRLEQARLTGAMPMAHLDPLGLRQWLPQPLKQFINRTLHKNHNPDTKMPPQKLLQKYHLADFYLTQTDIESSLDLLALCRPATEPHRPANHPSPGGNP